MRRESSLGFLLAVVANVSAPYLPPLSLSLSLSFTVQSIWLCFLLLLAAAAAAQQIFVIPDKHHLLLAACGPRPKLRL